jgi:hypothetical protein
MRAASPTARPPSLDRRPAAVRLDHLPLSPSRREAERRRAELLIDGVDLSAVVEQQRRLAHSPIRAISCSSVGVMDVHVMGIHAALEEERGEILVLEVVVRGPLGHLRHARAVPHQHLDHLAVMVAGR